MKNVGNNALPLRLFVSREEADFILNNHFDIAVPVFIRVLDGEEIYIECYPQVEELVRTRAAQYVADILTNRSLRALHASLLPYLQKWGYRMERNAMRRYDIYRSGEMQGDFSPVSGVRRLCEDDEDINRTTLDIAYAIQNGAIVFGYEENGEILSIAATHIYDDELPHDVEVMVETVPSARRRGLALSCLLALQRELHSMGHGVEYRCSTRNIKSGGVAQRAGLICVGQCHYCVSRAL